MHGEAGELALKVHELGAAIGQQHARLLVDLEPALGKPLLGRIDVVDGKADVALSASTVLLHDLDQRIIEVRNRGLDDGQAHRVVDFLSGVTFAIDGKIQRVGEKIFLCTPDDFIVEGNLTDTRQDDEFKMRGI